MSITSTSTGAEVQPRPRVVLCGNPRTAEFELAVRELSACVPGADIAQVADLPALREWLGEQDFPDLIVLVQTWSDEFHFADFLKLPGTGPFSRVICCYGPWCVSDGRSRQDFPLAVRVPLEDFSAALRQEWDQSTSPLPWTAGRDEIFSNRVGRVSRPVRDRSDGPGDPSSICVQSADRELTRMWIDALRAAGFTTTVEVANAQIVLWDVDVWTDLIAEQWRMLLERSPNTQIVALSGFAVPDLADKLTAAGAVKVLSKLLPLEALVSEVSRLDRKRVSPARDDTT